MINFILSAFCHKISRHSWYLLFLSWYRFIFADTWKIHHCPSKEYLSNGTSFFSTLCCYPKGIILISSNLPIPQDLHTTIVSSPVDHLLYLHPPNRLTQVMVLYNVRRLKQNCFFRQNECDWYEPESLTLDLAVGIYFLASCASNCKNKFILGEILYFVYCCVWY